MRPTTADQTGFSLLEMLVTMVIFSAGILGIAGLQVVSKQANFEGIQRVTASQVAYGLLEDLRTNGDAVESYVAAGRLGSGSQGESAPAPNCSTATSCTPLEKAAYDLWFWEQVIDGSQGTSGGSASGGLLLPGVCVTGPAGGAAGIYTVTVVWRGSASITNASGNDCGANSGNYGAQNEFRRIVEMPTYIDPAF